jgi:hypothetical protein
MTLRLTWCTVVLTLAIVMAPNTAAPVLGQGLVTITVPASVSFTVSNVTVPTAGSPAAARVSFSGLVVLPIQVLRISVRADSASFTSPSPGTPIPAALVSWTTSNASGGTGSSGTLNSATYTTLFQSGALQLSGGVDVQWALGAPGGGIRAGNHTLVVRYRLEAL